MGTVTPDCPPGRRYDVTDFDGEREQGPSWARANWPVIELDELNAGLDPTSMSIETLAARAKEVAASAGATAAEIQQAANDSVCAMMLIRTYRVRGHLAADLLGIATRTIYRKVDGH